jgi:hypothetical protein
MTIETSVVVSPLTKRILSRLETQPALVFQPDDSLEHQTTRTELIREHGFSCVDVVTRGQNYMVILNQDFPNLFYKF